jgi:hypothetical protein
MSDERPLPDGPVESSLPAPLRAGATIVGPLLILPRLALGAVGDIRAIARSTAELPEVRRQLAAMSQHIESLDREVLRMRQGVDAVGEEVVDLRADVRPITGAARRLGRFGRRRPPADPA